MDDSLDNYISKANFKVKVGNPRFKGNPGQNPATGGFQGKRKFGGHQSNQVTNVSITVPAVRKTAVNKNSTNQIRDARDRLVSKTKPVDARNKLNQKARNTDARQKLMAIRAKKEPVDARAKIQAKKQTQNTGTTNAQPGSFTLTRTVSNNSGGGGGNIHITPGTQGNVSITKTLTKVMPPGYDAVLGAPTKSLKPQNASKTSNVMKRLGTPAGQQSNIPNITRTITNPHKPVSKPQHMIQDHRAPVQQTHNIPYPPAQTNIPPYQHPQTNYTQPPPANVPPYPVQQPPHHPVPASPQYPPPVQTTLPYPPQDPIASREFQHQVIPKIEVQNDQYRPPEPQYPQFATPPNPQYAPPPQQYTYTQPQQQYYQPPVDNIYTPPPARQEMYQAPPDSYRSSQSSSSGSSFMKTIVNDVKPDVKPDRHFSSESSPLKRKSFGSSSYESSSASSSGPLRSSTINYIPVIETTGSVSSSKTSQKPKLSKVTAPGEPAVKRLKQEDEENVISPLQGYKVSITNLAPSVTQDDIIELFGAVGAVKSVKVVKNGIAEVVYVKKESAQEATKTYHDRELDGLPMVVKMVTPISARIKEAPEKLPPTMKPSATGPLELSKKSVVKPRSSQKDVDVTTLHKALFKTGTSGSSKPVTFTVNI